ncbi:nucleotidyltransferase domain-containing protein [Mesorhizobium sp. M1322]|uniref:nucleotidyltransferase family protein n=1 Tax=Mesorhizobium sp. M1322 TaxID=2957081 RepID=UPI0033380399
MMSMLTKADLDSIVSERAARHLRSFRSEAERIFPGKVTNVVLFGSRARGDSRRGSDYDVAVFISDLNNRRFVDHALEDAAYKHILAGVHISPVSVPSNYLNSDDELLALNIARDGVVIR